MSITDLEAAYIAGFLDGEGCFQIRHQPSKRDRQICSTVATVSVSQAEPRTAVLYWLRDLFGGCVTSHGNELRNPMHNKAMSWSVTGPSAVIVCTTVLPHLRLKRRHAELIIEHQATKAATRIGGRKGISRSALRVPPEVMLMRIAHIEEIGRLNVRGIPCQSVM